MAERLLKITKKRAFKQASVCELNIHGRILPHLAIPWVDHLSRAALRSYRQVGNRDMTTVVFI